MQKPLGGLQYHLRCFAISHWAKTRNSGHLTTRHSEDWQAIISALSQGKEWEFFTNVT